MQFDEKRYEELLIRHRRNRTNPEDLTERYAITLPATDAQIAAQVKAVRSYWNKICLGNSRASGVAKWCRTQDEMLARQPGTQLESSTWWQRQQAQRDAAAASSIQNVAEDLRQNYGSLGVVTSGTLDKFATSGRLSSSQAEEAAGRAGLTVIGKDVSLPDTAPVPNFGQLIREMDECGAVSVPDLIHPRSGPFSIVERYECAGDKSKRLDTVAVTQQSNEVEKRGASGADNARMRALRILRKADSDGVKLRDVALYHLVETVGGEPTSTSAKAKLEKLGVSAQDAAIIAVLLAERHPATPANGLDKVTSLLAAGQLREARAAAQNLTGGPDMAAEALQLVQAAQQRLDQFLGQAKVAVSADDEARAEALLKDAALISAEDAALALATLPPAPPEDLRASQDGTEVKLFWRPGPGHDEDTPYAVRRTSQRPPAAPTDGEKVHEGTGNACSDPRAPIARPVQYGVFVLGPDRRPASRPATVSVTLLPPVTRLKAEVGPATISLHWSARPDAEVRVTRTADTGAPAPVPVTGTGCHVTGLPEGKMQHFEVVAVYRGQGGAELRSAAEQISVTPRAEARPVPKLTARLAESGGVVRVRVTWPRVDNSDVKIMRSDAEPPWPFGTVITTEQMAQAGQELTGRVISAKNETGLETDLPGGVHHLVPLSVGGTGVAVGRATSVAITDPVRQLTAVPFADEARLSWEWPATAQMAEVNWTLDGEEDFYRISHAEYLSNGGARIPLGAGPCQVAVRAVILVGGKSYTSPPVSTVVSRVLDVPVSYHVSGLPAVGPFGGRAKKVVFTCEQGCSGVQVRMVASPGRVMPTKATDGVPVLETVLSLAAGVSEEHKITIPKPVKRPFWVRCFVVAGQARLIDPPISCLKET
jgi:hypothetical protein